MMVRWSGEVQVNVSECQVNVKSQSELDIGGRETCYFLWLFTFLCSFSRLVLINYFPIFTRLSRKNSNNNGTGWLKSSDEN